MGSIGGGDLNDLTLVMGNITGLSCFNLRVSQLIKFVMVGSIPLEIEGMLRQTSSVELSYKNVSGQVPSTVQFSYFNATSFVGNHELCRPYLDIAMTYLHQRKGIPYQRSIFFDLQAAFGHRASHFLHGLYNCCCYKSEGSKKGKHFKAMEVDCIPKTSMMLFLRG